jgi:hypothetical protein
MGGVSSRQAFKIAIENLQSSQVDPSGHEFWDQLWKTTLTVDEIFELAPAEDIRKIMHQQPGNLRTLFTQAVAQLFQVVETPYPVYFDQALNCAHILARILPFMVESKDPDVLSICWGVAKKKTKGKGGKSKGGKDAAAAATSMEATTAAGGFADNKAKEGVNNEKEAAVEEGSGGYTPPSIVVGEEKEDKKESEKEEEGDGEKEQEQEQGGNSGDLSASPEPAAVVLINSLFHLLFLPDFTIEDPPRDFREHDVNTPAFNAALMWAPGVGCNEKSVNSSTQFDKARIDVLRVMIACFSDALYLPPETYDSCRSLWLEVATSADVPYAEIVLYSLINTVLGYDPVGWGIPYGNMIATDTAKLLMETAVHALMILLDFGHPINSSIPTSRSGNNDGAEAPSSSSSAGPVGDASLPSVEKGDTRAQGFNVFRSVLGSIEDPDQLHFMFRGFVRLLTNIPQSDASYIPFSTSRVTVEQELLVLLWKCLEEVPKFMPYILRHCDVTELLQPICYYMLQGRKDPSKVGLMYLCTFTLLKLSGERNFGVALNKPHHLTIPVDVPLFSGSHADLLFICLHKMIVNGTEKLGALYNCFLTIICNVSPYCKSLNGTSSSKLVNLFSLFTSPAFLYGQPTNYIYVVMLLETFNNIVQYQYEGNANLIYAILRRKDIVDGLVNLTLDKALKAMGEEGIMGAPAGAAGAAGAANGKSATGKPISATRKSGSSEDLKAVSSPKQATDLVEMAAVERKGDVDVATADATVLNSPQRKPSGEKEGPPAGLSDEAPSSSSSSSSSSTAATDENEELTQGPFVPTEAWIEELRRELPLSTILRLLKHLAPQVEELAQSGTAKGTSGIFTSGTMDESQVLQFIRDTTMVGLLPVPHPIVIRKYQPNRYTALWFSAFMWGVIFMHNQRVPLFDSHAVRLFQVQTSRGSSGAEAAPAE